MLLPFFAEHLFIVIGTGFYAHHHAAALDAGFIMFDAFFRNTTTSSCEPGTVLDSPFSADLALASISFLLMVISAPVMKVAVQSESTSAVAHNNTADLTKKTFFFALQPPSRLNNKSATKYGPFFSEVSSSLARYVRGATTRLLLSEP